MIVAEFSNNHRGDLGLLKEMIAAAAAAGVSACKLQTHFAEDLSDEWVFTKPHVSSYELDEKGHEAFFRWCMEYKVLPVTSVYSAKYVEMLRRVGFTTLKLGSADVHKAALAKRLILAGFDLWVSTGGRPEELDIPEQTRVIFHCVSKYPHTPNESALLRMLCLRSQFPFSEVGFSSHVDPLHEGWNLPLELALLLGATWLEVHFTMLPREKTKDGPVSLDPYQLSKICKFDRLPLNEKYDSHEGLGMWLAQPGVNTAEKELIKKYKGRWKCSY